MKLAFILLLLPITVFAGRFEVFSVRSDFPMMDSQAMFRDIYINMGTNQGIKVGSKLSAYRTTTTIDEINQKTGRNISFKIANLQVIHADTDITVARVIDFLPPEKTPIATYTNVMVGDQVEVSAK